MSTFNGLRLRLRKIVMGTSFRYSEATNFEQFASKNRALVASFGSKDCVLFVSGSDNQLYFVFGWDQIAEGIRVLTSIHVRLDHVFSPERIVDYARSKGIVLVGLHDYATLYRKRMEDKAKARHTKLEHKKAEKQKQ